MSEFPQTWYRPARWGRDLLEELKVVKVTDHFLTVELFDSYRKAPYQRRQAKDGAKPSKVEALESVLASAAKEEQRGNDIRSRAIEKQKAVRAAIAEASK
jgi:hypothetical protein